MTEPKSGFFRTTEADKAEASTVADQGGGRETFINVPRNLGWLWTAVETEPAGASRRGGGGRFSTRITGRELQKNPPVSWIGKEEKSGQEPPEKKRGRLSCSIFRVGAGIMFPPGLLERKKRGAHKLINKELSVRVHALCEPASPGLARAEKKPAPQEGRERDPGLPTKKISYEIRDWKEKRKRGDPC